MQADLKAKLDIEQHHNDWEEVRKELVKKYQMVLKKLPADMVGHYNKVCLLKGVPQFFSAYLLLFLQQASAETVRAVLSAEITLVMTDSSHYSTIQSVIQKRSTLLTSLNQQLKLVQAFIAFNAAGQPNGGQLKDSWKNLINPIISTCTTIQELEAAEKNQVDILVSILKDIRENTASLYRAVEAWRSFLRKSENADINILRRQRIIYPHNGMSCLLMPYFDTQILRKSLLKSGLSFPMKDVFLLKIAPMRKYNMSKAEQAIFESAKEALPIYSELANEIAKQFVMPNDELEKINEGAGDTLLKKMVTSVELKNGPQKTANKGNQKEKLKTGTQNDKLTSLKGLKLGEKQHIINQVIEIQNLKTRRAYHKLQLQAIPPKLGAYMPNSQQQFPSRDVNERLRQSKSSKSLIEMTKLSREQPTHSSQPSLDPIDQLKGLNIALARKETVQNVYNRPRSVDRQVHSLKSALNSSRDRNLSLTKKLASIEEQNKELKTVRRMSSGKVGMTPKNKMVENIKTDSNDAVTGRKQDIIKTQFNNNSKQQVEDKKFQDETKRQNPPSQINGPMQVDNRRKSIINVYKVAKTTKRVNREDKLQENREQGMGKMSLDRDKLGIQKSIRQIDQQDRLKLQTRKAVQEQQHLKKQIQLLAKERDSLKRQLEQAKHAHERKISSMKVEKYQQLINSLEVRKDNAEMRIGRRGSSLDIESDTDQRSKNYNSGKKQKSPYEMALHLKNKSKISKPNLKQEGIKLEPSLMLVSQVNHNPNENRQLRLSIIDRSHLSESDQELKSSPKIRNAQESIKSIYLSNSRQKGQLVYKSKSKQKDTQRKQKQQLNNNAEKYQSNDKQSQQASLFNINNVRSWKLNESPKGNKSLNRSKSPKTIKSPKINKQFNNYQKQQQINIKNNNNLEDYQKYKQSQVKINSTSNLIEIVFLPNHRRKRRNSQKSINKLKSISKSKSIDKSKSIESEKPQNNKPQSNKPQNNKPQNNKPAMNLSKTNLPYNNVQVQKYRQLVVKERQKRVELSHQLQSMRKTIMSNYETKISQQKQQYSLEREQLIRAIQVERELKDKLEKEQRERQEQIAWQEEKMMEQLYKERQTRIGREKQLEQQMNHKRQLLLQLQLEHIKKTIEQEVRKELGMEGLSMDGLSIEQDGTPKSQQGESYNPMKSNPNQQAVKQRPNSKSKGLIVREGYNKQENMRINQKEQENQSERDILQRQLQLLAQQQQQQQEQQESYQRRNGSLSKNGNQINGNSFKNNYNPLNSNPKYSLPMNLQQDSHISFNQYEKQQLDKLQEQNIRLKQFIQKIKEKERVISQNIKDNLEVKKQQQQEQQLLGQQSQLLLQEKQNLINQQLQLKQLKQLKQQQQLKQQKRQQQKQQQNKIESPKYSPYQQLQFKEQIQLRHQQQLKGHIKLIERSPQYQQKAKVQDLVQYYLGVHNQQHQKDRDYQERNKLNKNLYDRNRLDKNSQQKRLINTKQPSNNSINIKRKNDITQQLNHKMQLALQFQQQLKGYAKMSHSIIDNNDNNPIQSNLLRLRQQYTLQQTHLLRQQLFPAMQSGSDNQNPYGSSSQVDYHSLLPYQEPQHIPSSLREHIGHWKTQLNDKIKGIHQLNQEVGEQRGSKKGGKNFLALNKVKLMKLEQTRKDKLRDIVLNEGIKKGKVIKRQLKRNQNILKKLKSKNNQVEGQESNKKLTNKKVSNKNNKSITNTDNKKNNKNLNELQKQPLQELEQLTRKYQPQVGHSKGKQEQQGHKKVEEQQEQKQQSHDQQEQQEGSEQQDQNESEEEQEEDLENNEGQQQEGEQMDQKIGQSQNHLPHQESRLQRQSARQNKEKQQISPARKLTEHSRQPSSGHKSITNSKNDQVSHSQQQLQDQQLKRHNEEQQRNQLIELARRHQQQILKQDILSYQSEVRQYLSSYSVTHFIAIKTMPEQQLQQFLTELLKTSSEDMLKLNANPLLLTSVKEFRTFYILVATNKANLEVGVGLFHQNKRSTYFCDYIFSHNPTQLHNLLFSMSKFITHNDLKAIKMEFLFDLTEVKDQELINNFAEFETKCHRMGQVYVNAEIPKQRKYVLGRNLFEPNSQDNFRNFTAGSEQLISLRSSVKLIATPLVEISQGFHDKGGNLRNQSHALLLACYLKTDRTRFEKIKENAQKDLRFREMIATAQSLISKEVDVKNVKINQPVSQQERKETYSRLRKVLNVPKKTAMTDIQAAITDQPIANFNGTMTQMKQTAGPPPSLLLKHCELSLASSDSLQPYVLYEPKEQIGRVQASNSSQTGFLLNLIPKHKTLIMPAEEFLRIQAANPQMDIFFYIKHFFRNISIAQKETMSRIYIPRVVFDSEFLLRDESALFRELIMHQQSIRLGWDQLLPFSVTFEPSHRDTVIQKPFILAVMSAQLERMSEGTTLFAAVIS